MGTHGCLFNRLFRRWSKKSSKLRVTSLCAGDSPRPVNSPYKGPVTLKMFPFDDVIMTLLNCGHNDLRTYRYRYIPASIASLINIYDDFLESMKINGIYLYEASIDDGEERNGHRGSHIPNIIPPPNEVGGGYTGFTLSVRLSVRLSVCL